MPSSVVARYYYDADKANLTIVFVSGAVYKYLKVPESEYTSFKQSRSKGEYLNKFIKGKYAYKKVD